MRFYEALNVQKGITAVIGGGGKSTLIKRLAEELAGLGSVIACTSTHMYPVEGLRLLTGASQEDIRFALEDGKPICVGEWEGAKLISPAIGIAKLSELADYVLVEADGSKGLPLKAHNRNEPCIPEGAFVIYVVGADGIGHPIGEVAHRPELYAAALEVDEGHIVTPSDAAKMVDHGDTVLFNKAETTERKLYGSQFASAFHGYTVIASLGRGEVYEIVL